MSQILVTQAEISEQVLFFMGQKGILPDDPSKPLVLDGRIHRYHVQGDSQGTYNGFYCAYPYKNTCREHRVMAVRWRGPTMMFRCRQALRQGRDLQERRQR